MRCHTSLVCVGLNTGCPLCPEDKLNVGAVWMPAKGHDGGHITVSSEW